MDTNTDAVEGTESATPQGAKRQDHSTPRPSRRSDLGDFLFDQMASITQTQAIASKIGRQQMANEVLCWAAKFAIKGEPLAALIALCNRELLP